MAVDEDRPGVAGLRRRRQALAALEDDDRGAAAGKSGGDGRAADAGADDDDVGRGHRVHGGDGRTDRAVQPAGNQQTAFLKAELTRRLKAIATHIERLEAEIARRVKADPVLQHRVELLLTIPGVGLVTAMAMAIGLPELGSCTGKAASLLAGLAPLADDSGQRTGERYIRGGRASVRCALYFAALTASRFNPPLAEDYNRL